MRFSAAVRLRTLLPLCAFLLLLCSGQGFAQNFFHPNQFGKNRLQYQRFDWHYIETPHFEIYYYNNGYTIAKIAAAMAEEDYNKLTSLVGFAPYFKSQIFLYNSVQDLRQSNIGIYTQGYAISGQTNFVRPQIEVAYTGEKTIFRKELARGIADGYLFEMMYGGSLKDALRNNLLLNLPPWFMTGAANYIAYGWSQDMDDYMQAFFKDNKKRTKIEYLQGENGRIVGQSMWNYLVETYGKSNMASVLNLTRVIRDEKQAIENTLGVSYKQFVKGWSEFYERQFSNYDSSYIDADPSKTFTKNRKNKTYNSVRISPDGRRMAYTENDRGKFEVVVRDLVSGKESKIFKGGYRVASQQIDYNTPLVDWLNNQELVIFNQMRGKNFMWIYNTNSWGLWQLLRNKKKRIEFDFEHVTDFDISKDGNTLVFSGENRGQSDIYLHDIKKRRTFQITKDLYDDRHPAFMPNGQDIVFTSNRLEDSTRIRVAELADITPRYNLFLYNKERPETLTRLSNSASTLSKPLVINNNELLFLNNEKGMEALYLYSLQDSTSHQITRFKTSMQEYDAMGGKIAYVLRNKGKDQIYIDDLVTDNHFFTQKTLRKTLVDLREIKEMKRRQEEAERERKEMELLEQLRQEEQQREKAMQDSLSKIMGDSTLTEEQIKLKLKPEKVKEDVEVNTYDYSFDDEQGNRRRAFMDRYRNKLKLKELEGKNQRKQGKPKDYENRFTTDGVVTSMMMDPLRGFGLLLEANMTDILENHKINAGIFGVFNLRNSSYFVEYKYLERRFDYGVKFERNNLQLSQSGGQFMQNYGLNQLEFSISYPLTIRSRITLLPFVANTRYTDLSALPNSILSSDARREYVGGNIEYVFDNTTEFEQNMLRGTRFRVRLNNWFCTNKGNQNFSNLSVDFRKYTKIVRSLTLATRIAYGKFFGDSPKSYRLGGMDNWFFNQSDGSVGGFDENVTTPPDQTDLLFTQFATNLRGFNYNKVSGTDFIVGNFELRMPVMRMFTSRVVKSNFLRNLQLTGFFDIGSAWTGISPFREENSQNIDYIQDGSFSAEVKNFKQPFLMGVGPGIRSQLLGYYLKLDAAWGIEDGFIKRKPRYYLTLGYDF